MCSVCFFFLLHRGGAGGGTGLHHSLIQNVQKNTAPSGGQTSYPLSPAKATPSPQLKMIPVVLHFVPPLPPSHDHTHPAPPPQTAPPKKQIRKCCVRFYWLEQSKSRRATLRRPRHCVWRCCGDANVTRCCPLSHVTSVMDVEWFWSGGGGVKEREEGGEEVRREKSISPSQSLQQCPVWWEKGAACTDRKCWLAYEGVRGERSDERKKAIKQDGRAILL